MTALVVALLAGIGPWAVAVLAVLVFAETGLMAGFFLPGDSVLFATGVLVTAGVVQVPLAVVIGVIATAAFLGDQLGYTIGRRFGPRVLDRPGSRWRNPAHIARAQGFFTRHGPKAVVLARFVPVARTFVPVIAGVGEMPRVRFSVFNVLGAVGWTGVMLVAGSLLGGVPLVAQHIEIVAAGLVAVSIVPAVVAAWVRRRRRAGVEVVEERVLVGSRG